MTGSCFLWHRFVVHVVSAGTVGGLCWALYHLPILGLVRAALGGLAVLYVARIRPCRVQLPGHY
jgi:predicted membrane-bound spermidine synthase